MKVNTYDGMRKLFTHFKPNKHEQRLTAGKDRQFFENEFVNQFK